MSAERRCGACIVAESGEPPAVEAPYIAAISDVTVLGLGALEGSLCPEHRERLEQFVEIHRCHVAQGRKP